MYEARDFAKDFERNRRIVHLQCDGLSHEESLIQPAGGNCLNWTIGHVLVHRDKIIRECGGEPLLDEIQTDRYANESDPVTEDGPNVIPLDDLLSLLDRSQEALGEALGSVDLGEDQLVGDRTVPRWKRIHFLYFHDTYHVGQTELHRGLAGRTDSLI